MTQGPGGQSEIVDLEGKPLLDAKTRSKVELAEFNRRLGRSGSVTLGREEEVRPRLWAYGGHVVGDGWHATSDTLWYYWARYGRLVGYDLATRRCIGSLGPKGSAQDLAGGGDRFTNPPEHTGHGSLSTATTLYRLDLEKRTTQAVVHHDG